MQSRYLHLKPDAIKMRKLGNSIKSIEKNLGIPRSTLSTWLRTISLTVSQQNSLKNDQRNALKSARIKASLWHRQQKILRMKEAENQAKKVVSAINIQDTNIQELALAILYLGEGFKNDELGIGNSDPLILKFFLALIFSNFPIVKKSIRCELYLRADQNPQKMKEYWSKELHLPLDKFSRVSIDKRTQGSKTYSNYNGVCTLRFGNVAVQRKLLYIAETYCKRIIKGS